MKSFLKRTKENDRTWSKNVKLARALNCLNVSDSQKIHVLHAKTAKKTWDQLRSIHERINLINKLFLFRKLNSIKYNESIKMQDQINSVLELAAKLRNIG